MLRSGLRRLLRLLVASMLALLAGLGGGCASSYPEGGLPSLEGNRLAGSTWSLISMQPPGAKILFIDSPENYLLQFKNESAMIVRADCFTCNGTYNTTGRTLTVLVDCLETGCPPGSFGDRYMVAINDVTSFSMTKNELYVNYGAERGRLTFLRHEPGSP